MRGLDEAQRAFLLREWRAYVAERAPGSPLLDVDVESDAAIDDDSPFGAKDMKARFMGTTAVYEMAEGSASVPLTGSVAVHLAPTSRGKQGYALVNLIAAAVAWRLPTHGALMLHAAGIVLDGRAFVMIGAEGAGKTTWALAARAGGAEILSDDVVLVARSPRGFEALGSPFRSAQHGTLGAGRWPLCALLLADHGPTARLLPASPVVVQARLLANLPYVAEASADPRAGDLVETLAASVPARILTFAPDPSFVSLLRTFPGAV